MKAIGLSFLFLFGFCLQCNSQVEVRERLYFNKGGRQVWIIGTEGQKTTRALLYKVSKDSVFYIETLLKTLAVNTPSHELKRIHFSQIDTLVTMKNNPGAKGAIAGSLIGFAAGVIIRAATYDPDPITQFAVGITGGEAPYYFGAGLLGAATGAAVGAGIGQIAKKKWVIGGQEANFQKALLDLDKRAYWNRTNRPKQK